MLSAGSVCPVCTVSAKTRSAVRAIRLRLVGRLSAIRIGAGRRFLRMRIFIRRTAPTVYSWWGLDLHAVVRLQFAPEHGAGAGEAGLDVFQCQASRLHDLVVGEIVELTQKNHLFIVGRQGLD